MDRTFVRFGLAAAVTVAVVTGCGPPPPSDLGPANAGQSPEASATSREIHGCPVTVPPQSGFVPPKPYPPEPPLEQVWFGTAELWTLLDREGAVWSGLSVGKGPHPVGDKTLWFSENFSTAQREDFSADADITLTAVHLDGSARTVVQEGGVPSFNSGIKNFMLVPLGLPEAGCWELTATYRNAELSYVFLIKDDHYRTRAATHIVPSSWA
ncbi:MAG TPA: hypothetical protein VM784_10050 [Actinomycetota bacterium]|nr:hypothetical protein [Actinomycetota bacterium]